ncbi:MAG TPA: Wzz/FepE/Etk N-terminal domain-containing protein, partial [Longimicrobium sp.]|nr:Wzz/FepE/Etk N-terminal domain-containing protein [Longimicrobium sp.]
MSQADNRAQGAAAPAAAPAAPREVTVLDLANVVLRYRRSIVLVPLLFMAVGVALSLRTPRTYRADGAFILQDGGGNPRSRVSGLAAQFGVQVAGGGTDVPQLYADLLLSRRFMTELATTRFDFSDGGRRRVGTPAQLLEVDAGSPRATLRSTVKVLKGSVNAEVNPMTGVVGFGVSTPWPALSEQIGKRLLEMVTQFNLSTRQSQAAAERKFTEGRLNEATRELRAAENALQDFMQSNRRFDNAPQLLLRRERLQRDVTEHQAVYAMLSQAYEQARIDEVRDTPVLTVIEGPVGSAQPEPRGTVTRGLLLLLLG